jgi:hypothetical protein
MTKMSLKKGSLAVSSATTSKLIIRHLCGSATLQNMITTYHSDGIHKIPALQSRLLQQFYSTAIFSSLSAVLRGDIEHIHYRLFSFKWHLLARCCLKSCSSSINLFCTKDLIASSRFTGSQLRRAIRIAFDCWPSLEGIDCLTRSRQHDKEMILWHLLDF